jgi:hypothetical protein
MEVIGCSETPADFCCTMRHYIPEDGTLHDHCCENLTRSKNTVTHLINGLPGNSFVNTGQHATVDEAVFSVIHATPSAGNGPMNSQSVM